MARIFHQNMRVYGGGAGGRNAAYLAALTAINGITGAVYWAAGFTEITNGNAPLRAALSTRAQALDAGLTNIVVIEVGTSALGTREFIGITWDSAAGLNVQHAGQALWNPVNHGWPAYNNAIGGAPINQTINLPMGVALGADTRGLAYIAGLSLGGGMGGAALIIAFMHNMYALG
ncbi:MAG TPA: hypothetical protein VJZ91_16220, partial [Blastocatellia bacterium]|nr:hypothetical protein [Blastocatellia bacterium]